MSGISGSEGPSGMSAEGAADVEAPPVPPAEVRKERVSGRQGAAIRPAEQPLGPVLGPCGARAGGGCASTWGSMCCHPRTQKALMMSYCNFLLALLAGIMAIIALSGFKSLGPEDQVVVEYHGDKHTVEGPGTVWLNPFGTSMERRKAFRLGPLQYIVVKNQLTGVPHNVNGPDLLFLGPYEETVNLVKQKVVLKNDQFLRLVDKETGRERVVTGPATVTPEPTESIPMAINGSGAEQAVFLDRDSAALILNRETGQQTLVKKDGDRPGVFFPSAHQQVLEVRELIQVLPHKAIVVKDPSGFYTVHSGQANNGSGTSFFLPPHAELVRLSWSSFGLVDSTGDAGSDEVTKQQELHQMPGEGAGGSQQLVTKVEFSMMDLRTRTGNFMYEVRTNDNVKLHLTGVLFWRIADVRKMIANTPDPSGDVWQHSRSALIQAVSQAKLSSFMDSFNQIVQDAFLTQAQDGFYAERGLEVISMELTRWEPSDQKTAEILLEIIQETTNRINRLQAQQSENEVRAAALSAQNEYDEIKIEADIALEQKRGQLIRAQAENAKVGAELEGEAGGLKAGKDAAAFIGGLRTVMPDVNGRVELYKLQQTLASNNEKARHLATGNNTLFVTPADLQLRLSDGSLSTGG